MSTRTLDERLVELHLLRDRIEDEIQAAEEAIARFEAVERRAIEEGLRARPRRNRRVARCGTPSGYYRHRRTLNEPACDACRAAHRVAEALRVQRRQAKAKLSEES